MKLSSCGCSRSRREFLMGVAAAYGAGILAQTSAASAMHGAAIAASKPAFWRNALTPPMGWNSYDNYGGSVTEGEYLANARYMQTHLRHFGYQYAVIDYLWFDPQHAPRSVWQRGPLAMDSHGRLQPALNKFPSAKNGQGFAPLSRRIGGMGLKFGFHIMRGIPRLAVEKNLPIEGSSFKARDAADIHSTCSWNSDMYGVRGNTAAGQAYYNSLIRLYRTWGCEFIKVDDLSRPYHKAEIHALRRALNRYGPHIVFSTSPGAMPVSEGVDIMHNANMWRIRDDFWDSWPLVDNMFDLTAAWKGFAGPGHWPDLDMLCLGRIGERSVGGPRFTRFNRHEQRTVMTFWAMAPSPLMLGMNLTRMDPWTLSLIANPAVLAINQDMLGAQAIRRFRHGPMDAWTKPLHNGDIALSVINRGSNQRAITTLQLPFESLGLSGKYNVNDLWSNKPAGSGVNGLAVSLVGHESRLYRMSRAL